jgi:excinuclease ABC subunit C
MTDLERTISSMPTQPGVYLHKDAAGDILYVGKAKNLRSRVRSYFQEGRPTDAKTRILVSKIAAIEVIVTDTEAEALILENTLIKQHRPKYNILLKDDKSYPYVRITREQYPRVFKTRRVIKDGSKYFGPYTDGTYLYHLLQAIRSVLPIRTCDLPLTEEGVAKGKWKVCLQYHIKKCDGPCIGEASKDQYNEVVRQAHQILSGKTRELERSLEQRMQDLAEQLRFEDAAVVRERLERLREYVAKQKVVTTDSMDRDVFGMARIGTQACTVVFTVRDGKLVGKRHFLASDVPDGGDAELLRSTLEQWYVDADSYPDEVLVPIEPVDVEFMAAFLREKKGRIVDVQVPRIGDKRKLIAMAENNADLLLRETLALQAQRDQTVSKTMLALQADLRMRSLPRRIECFDNSHMQGTDYVSSMVVFVDGKSRRSEYRKFKLREIDHNNDFEAMKEVVRRRYTRVLEEQGPLPDLVVIDGGKGQLSHAMEVITELGLEGKMTVVGMAKRLEEIFVPDQRDPLLISKSSPSLRLLQQVRDEAHRFAITYHRTLREKRTLQTELTQIPGIGTTTAEKLLRSIGSVEAVKEASLDSLQAVVGAAAARKVHEYYHPAPHSSASDV